MPRTKILVYIPGILHPASIIKNGGNSQDFATIAEARAALLAMFDNAVTAWRAENEVIEEED